jgi:hypothetical protein
MWDAASVALLKKLWASGHSAAQIATRLGHSRNAVCAKLLHGLEARPQTAHRQTQDRVGAEARASAVGGLCSPGSQDFVYAQASSEAS